MVLAESVALAVLTGPPTGLLVLLDLRLRSTKLSWVASTVAAGLVALVVQVERLVLVVHRV